MSHVQAEVITIGNELLYGQVVNKNATFISNQLFQAGFTVTQVTTVADDIAVIMQVLEAAQQRGTQLVITTGGLGPTCDDVTWKALSQYFSCPHINSIQHASALSASSITASIIEGRQGFTCMLIPNPVGSAWGICCKVKGGPYVVALPGVPMEVQAML
jgi:nicotinamide-nucleotide amidase